MLKDPEFKKEIFVSVIAAILTIIFIEPILKLIWGIMSWFGTTTYQGFLDMMYKNASLGHRNYIDFMIVAFFFSAIIGISAEFIVRLTTKNPVAVKKFSKSPKLKKILIVLFVILIILALILVTTVFVDLQLNASFQQRITVLAPKISDQEYKELLASWASMENRADYEILVSHMESLAQQNDIVLPDLLLKK